MLDNIIKSIEKVSKYRKLDLDKEIAKLGFAKVKDDYRFNVFLCERTKNFSEDEKSFIIRNYDNFIRVYCSAKEKDILTNKESKLTKFLFNSICNFPEDARYIALNSICYAKDRGIDDESIIEFAESCIKNAYFIKSEDSFKRIDIWPKFLNNLDKIWLEQYIKNEFNKDCAWNYIKKIAYHDSRYSEHFDQRYNIWRIRKSKVNVVGDILKDHLKYGGVIKMKFEKKFNCFIPIETETKDGHEMTKMIIEKDSDGKVKKIFLTGIASNNKIDREDERMTSEFIQKMANTAEGLTLFYEHKHDIEHTMGHISNGWLNEDKTCFYIKAELEPPTVNPLVERVIGKIKSGTKIGFSVSGLIKEAKRVWDKEHEKEIYEMSDGILDEVSVTAWPAAYDTWASAVSKSLNEGKFDNNSDGVDINKILSHSSKIADSEPYWDNIDKSLIPTNGYADYNASNSKSSDGYPHHWVKNGKKNDDGVYVAGDMYLHKGGLEVAWNNATKQGASPNIISHLQRHRAVLGLCKAIDDLKEFGDNLDSINDAEEIVAKSKSKILDLIIGFKDSLNKSSKDKSCYDDKIQVVEKVTKEYTGKLVALIEEMYNMNTEKKDG